MELLPLPNLYEKIYALHDFVLTVVFMDTPDDEDVFTWSTLRGFLLKK